MKSTNHLKTQLYMIIHDPDTILFSLVSGIVKKFPEKCICKRISTFLENVTTKQNDRVSMI